MAEFRFTPRALLELGRELISSDEVALYELIKNSVDAESPTIEIFAEIVFPSSGFRAALELVNGGNRTVDAFQYIQKTIFQAAGKERIEAFLKPLEESIGNKQRFVDVLKTTYASNNWIEVRDTGHGMTLSELDRIFLTVGTRSRRAENVTGATYLGDKGVGRLSTMRLGDRLNVRTTTAGAPHWNLLEIDWSLFNHDTTQKLSDIQIEPRRGERKPNAALQGTIVRISELSADWSQSRFNSMFEGQIARMVDPFDAGKANRLLTVRYNGDRVAVPSIPAKLLSSAHAVCKVEFSFDKEDEPQLKGTIDYKLKDKKEIVTQSGAEIYSVAQRAYNKRGKKGHAAQEFVPISPQALKNLGAFSVQIYWFNRRVVEAIAGLTANAARTKDEIRQWSGGPMLYRRGYRILPYGDPDNDWLELDKRAFGQPGFKLNRQQVIGRVTVNSSHMSLSEQTNREGLIESDASEALKTILTWLVHVEFRAFINKIDALDQSASRHAEEATARLHEAQERVEDALQSLRRAIGPDHIGRVERLRETVTELVEECESLVSKQEEAVAETVGEREKFVHLAGIGLITEFIFHELDRAVKHTLQVLPETRGQRREQTLDSLEAQLITLQKRVSAFDELSGEKRQSKSTFDLSPVVETVIANHANQFERHGITVEFDGPPRPYRIRAVRGMVIQILENLIVNAVYWLKQQKKYERGFRPTITISLDEDEHSLTVEDNGTGVDPSRREKIFEPFVSSKPPADGGRGLGLYISRELAEYNGWQLYLDEEVGRKRKGRLSLFVLDMDGKND